MNTNGAGRHSWVPTNSANLYGGDGGVCARACVCVHAIACIYVRDVFAIYTIIIFDPG